MFSITHIDCKSHNNKRDRYNDLEKHVGTLINFFFCKFLINVQNINHQFISNKLIGN